MFAGLDVQQLQMLLEALEMYTVEEPSNGSHEENHRIREEKLCRDNLMVMLRARLGGVR